MNDFLSHQQSNLLRCDARLTIKTVASGKGDGFQKYDVGLRVTHLDANDDCGFIKWKCGNGMAKG